MWPFMQWGNGLVVRANLSEKRNIVHRSVYAGIVVLFISPFAALFGTEILTHGSIQFGLTELSALGLILGIWVIGTIGGFILINIHRRKEILLGNIYGAIAFLCLFWTATNLWGYIGAILVLLVAFSAANLTLFIESIRSLRGKKSEKVKVRK